MIELIFLIILIFSLIGMGVMVFQKIPLLLEVPETLPAPLGWQTFISKIKKSIKISSPFKNFSTNIFLQKILSKIRILTLKTDSKTSTWLQKLRARSHKKQFKESDNYWQEIKKSTRK